jgi:hypothetical protein
LAAEIIVIDDSSAPPSGVLPLQIHGSGGGGPHAGCGPPVDSLPLEVSALLLLLDPLLVLPLAVLLLVPLSLAVLLELDVDMGPPQKPCSHRCPMPHCESSSHGSPSAPSPLKQLASSPTRIDARRNGSMIAARSRNGVDSRHATRALRSRCALRRTRVREEGYRDA